MKLLKILLIIYLTLLIMKKKLIMLLWLLLVMSSCGQEVAKNPDPGFNEAYQGDASWEAAIPVPDKKEINQKNMEEKQYSEIDQLAVPTKWDMIAEMKTSMWIIKIRLFEEATPKTFENFKGLSDKWFYDWLVFHRVIDGFMIQWWDPEGTWMWWESIYGTPFEDEPHPNLSNVRWALAMANRWPGTNTSQFFIVQAPSAPHLDGFENWKNLCGQIWKSCHTVFGQVYEWIEIVDKIAKVKTSWLNRPEEDVKIESVIVSEVE